MYLTSEAVKLLAEGQGERAERRPRSRRRSIPSTRGLLDKSTKLHPKTWVKVAVALALGLGTMIGWKRIVVTVGEKHRQDASDLRAGRRRRTRRHAGTIMVSPMPIGLPVSTTHVLSSGVAGTMAANGSGIQWATLRSIAPCLGADAALRDGDLRHAVLHLREDLLTPTPAASNGSSRVFPRLERQTCRSRASPTSSKRLYRSIFRPLSAARILIDPVGEFVGDRAGAGRFSNEARAPFSFADPKVPVGFTVKPSLARARCAPRTVVLSAFGMLAAEWSLALQISLADLVVASPTWSSRSRQAVAQGRPAWRPGHPRRPGREASTGGGFGAGGGAGVSSPSRRTCRTAGPDDAGSSAAPAR